MLYEGKFFLHFLLKRRLFDSKKIFWVDDMWEFFLKCACLLLTKNEMTYKAALGLFLGFSLKQR